jgi:hypothetical protein
VDGIDVFGFHQLCFAVTKEAGVAVPGDRSEPAFLARYPTHSLRAAGVVGARYDARIVDEGQDLHEDCGCRC